MKSLTKVLWGSALFLGGAMVALAALTLYYWQRVSVNTVLMHITTLNDVPLRLMAIFAVGATIVAVMFVVFGMKLHKKWRLLLCLCAICFFAYTFKLDTFIRGIGEKSYIYENEYVSWTDDEKSSPKHNLIILYLESMEDDYRHDKNGDNLLPELSKLYDKNYHFDDFVQLEHTFATILSQVAGLCGVIYKNDFSNNDISSVSNNTLANAICMPDVLAKKGYNTFFIKVASLNFTMTGKIMAQHSFKELLGWHELKNIPGIKKGNGWGISDNSLYEIIKQKLSQLAKQDKPFLAVITTLDTHFPDTFFDNKCTREFNDERDAVKCADKMAMGFIKWLQKQDFYQNTTIVIVGDHINNSVSHSGDEIFNVIINPVEGLQKQPHKWTTLDLAPTMLEAIGINAPKFGLGRSLWQKEPTLIEKYGDKLDWEFYKSSEFYRKLAHLHDTTVDIKNFINLPLNTKILKKDIESFIANKISVENLIGFYSNDTIYADELNFSIETKKDVCINMKFLVAIAKNQEDHILVNNKEVAVWSLTKDEEAPFKRTICLKRKDIPEDGKIVLKIDRKMKCNIFTCGYGWQEIEVAEQ